MNMLENLVFSCSILSDELLSFFFVTFKRMVFRVKCDFSRFYTIIMIEEKVMKGLKKMRALVIEKFGGIDQLKMKDVEEPSLREDRLLIEVYATSVNPIDSKRRKGLYGGKLPMIVGGDVAGIVKEVGANVQRFRPGDRVMANGAKTYAEYVSVREEVTAKLPDNVSFIEAAAVPLTGQTAWQALMDFDKIRSGDRVLIHAGAGGVGSLAIQIAKEKDAWIAATASETNQEFLSSLGVHRPINYEAENFYEVLENIDFVLDPIGGEVQNKSLSVLRRGGTLVSIAEEPDQEKASALEVNAHWFSMRPTKNGIENLRDLLMSRKLKPIVAKEYAFTEEAVRDAHREIETGHGHGKLIIRIKE